MTRQRIKKATVGEREIKQVIRELEDKRISLAAIGRELGVSRQSVARVLRRPEESARIRSAIIEKLGRDPWAKPEEAA